MKTIILIIFTFLLNFASLAGVDYIMHWMVDNNTIYNEDGTTTTIANSGAEFARIFIIPSQDGNSMELMQIERNWVGGRYVYSEGTLAKIGADGLGAGKSGQTVYANLSNSGFDVDDEIEYRFYVELGKMNSYDQWSSIARSDYVSYNQISDSIQAIETFRMGSTKYVSGWSNTPAYGDWYFRSIPEPSSGILMILGISCLLLKRRIRQKNHID